MSKNWSCKGTESSKDKKFCPENPGQNIWIKIEESCKTG